MRAGQPGQRPRAWDDAVGVIAATAGGEPPPAGMAMGQVMGHALGNSMGSPMGNPMGGPMGSPMGQGAGASMGAAPSAAVPSPAARWSLSLRGQVTGPLTDEMVRGMVSRGELDPSTPAWRPGASGWAPLRSYPEFVEFNPPAPEPPGR